MTNKKFMMVALLITIILNIIPVFGQDAIYYEKDNYTSKVHQLYIGQSFSYRSGGDQNPGSFKILNENTAIKIIMLDRIMGATEPYPWMFLYADGIIEQPSIGAGTSQYCEHNLLVVCSRSGNLPQPDIFIPIDYSNIHPDATPPLKFKSGHRMLVLRRAFIYENSENIGGMHGPYGSVSINACNPSIDKYSYEQLVSRPWLWLNNRYFGCRLPGPIYAAAVSGPNPHSEWIDGPWGCYYSNIAIYDWNTMPAENGNIAVVIGEGDVTNPDDFLGKMIVNQNTNGPILMKVRIFGWLILQNLDISGPEPSVDIGRDYWYGSWDGSYPEVVKGPDDHRVGTQYVPWRCLEEVENNVPAGSIVGLLGGKFPAVTLSKKMIYKAADQPAIFGR